MKNFSNFWKISWIFETFLEFLKIFFEFLKIFSEFLKNFLNFFNWKNRHSEMANFDKNNFWFYNINTWFFNLYRKCFSNCSGLCALEVHKKIRNNFHEKNLKFRNLTITKLKKLECSPSFNFLSFKIWNSPLTKIQILYESPKNGVFGNFFAHKNFEFFDKILDFLTENLEMWIFWIKCSIIMFLESPVVFRTISKFF